MSALLLRHLLAATIAFTALVNVVVPHAAIAQEAERPQAGVRVPPVTVAEASIRQLLRRVPISGTLVSREEALVYPEIGGHKITQLEVEVGDRVEDGEIVAQLEDRTLRSEVARAEAELARSQAAAQQSRTTVASAEARLTQAQQALERTRQLQERGTSTQAALDEATATALTAQAELESARSGVAVAEAQLQQAETALKVVRENLETARIRAPVAGVISARNGQLGATASTTGEPIYTIIRNGEVEVEVEVIETDLGLLSEGDPAQVEVAGVGQVDGTVRLISPQVDRTDRMGTVRITIEQQDGLRPGLYAGGWVTAESRRNLAVPASAVISDTSGAYVLRVNGDTVQRRPVTPGLVWQDWREIVSGLDTGDNVITRAGAFYDDGDVIRPVRGETAGPEADERDAAMTGADSP